MKKLIALLVAILFVSGCASIDAIARRRLQFINYTGAAYAPQQKDYPVDLFFEGQPKKNYDIIGEIIGTADTGDDVRPMLEARTRQVGADGVINISLRAKSKLTSEIVDVPVTGRRGYITEVPVSRPYTYDVINIRAKVIKYKQ